MVGSDSVRLIRGSGVDLTRFSPTPEPDGTPVVLLATRMLREKGVGEFIEASRRLRTRNVQARFVLVGDVDRENPGSLSAGELRAWAAGGNVEWLGHTDDMPGALAKSHIVCLPSYYREGVPKVLLEAAACGRPVIATDMPGCRDIVRHEKTGLLVAPRDPQSLADAIETLLRDRDSRLKYGKAARALVEAEFSIGAVVEQTLALYEELLSSPGATRMVVGSVVA
jgi:glycosyltransferase involved in cell wall biosynthesis